MDDRFSITKRIHSFKYAIEGLKTLFREEHNSRVHLLAALLAIGMGLFFKISLTEWFAIIFAISFVFAMEIMNTAIENIADFISPEKHDAIKRIKDLAAAGVLVSALAAALVGILIFIPKIFFE